jgi:hypothetical protein
MTPTIIYTTAPKDYDYSVSTDEVNPNWGAVTDTGWEKERGNIVRKVVTTMHGQADRYMSGLYLTRTEDTIGYDLTHGNIELRATAT